MILIWDIHEGVVFVDKLKYNLLLSEERFVKQEEYWLSKLWGEIEETRLLPDIDLGAGCTGKESIAMDFTDDLWSKILKISKNSDMSVYLLLLTGLKCLFHIYLNKNDILIGSPVLMQSRNEETLNDIVALRSEIADDLSFKECLLKIRQTVLEAYENQDYPFEKILEYLKVPVKEDSPSIVNTFCLLNNLHEDAIIESGKSELVFCFEKTEAELCGRIYYNPSVYGIKTVEQLKTHYISILSSCLGNLDQKIGELEVLSEKEKDIVLNRFNNTGGGAVNTTTLNAAFQRQVSITPENTAVCCGKKKLTYRQLNEEADRIAWLLKEKGTEKESIVAIMIGHCVEMAAGILGILKSGGAYMPIDPAYPEDRIKYMLRDSGAKVLLVSDKAGTEKFDLGIDIIDISESCNMPESSSSFDCGIRSDNLAYIIYTSGSTGMPKGTMIEHRSIFNYIQWRMSNYSLNEKDSALQMISVSFDGFGSNFYSTLLSGGKLVIPEEDKYRDYFYIKELIKNEGVTNMSLVPSMYRAILENAEENEFDSLRFVVLAGEKADSQLIRQSRVKSPKTTLINEYGPTENSVTTTAFFNLSEQTVSIIGQPISNNRVYILRGSTILPAGVPGELCVTGEGLARGYLNRPELTSEKFVDNPFEAGKKMYRTGDLARWRQDGTIEFLGRLDHQVKVRGYRIELGEIESVLKSHCGVQDAVAVNFVSQEGDSYLCAYIVTQTDITEELKVYTANFLPYYMVPSYFLRIANIPFTPNGKVDRRALPKPEINKGKKEYVAPATATEKKLSEIWTALLGVEQISIDDNFFELGGHSLKATALLSKIHKEFDAAIELSKVFNCPTIRKIAEQIDMSQKSPYSSIEPAPAREGFMPGCYPASPAQRRMYILNQLEEGQTSYNMPVALSVSGAIERDRLEKVFQGLIERHEALRTSFLLYNGEPVQKIHPEVDFHLEFAELQQEDNDNKLLEEFVRPFDLGAAPLIRVKLVELPDKARHILMFDMHHIIADGVSLDIIIREFLSLYKEENLKPVRIQYKDFSEVQNRLLASEAMKKQEDYWLDIFSGEIPVLDLPTDYSRPAYQSFEGDRITFSISREVYARLNAMSAKTGATLYMLLLSAYYILLSKYTRQEDIIVASPVAGRPHADLDEVIGMFVNTLAMRNYPVSGKTFNDFLYEVRENSIKAFENQDYQFEELIEKLRLKHDLSRNPLFDTMFTLNNIDISEISIEGLRFQPMIPENRISKFDISLDASVAGDTVGFVLEYCTKLFKKETMIRFAGHYSNILEQVVSNPGIELGEIDMLSTEEKALLIQGFNANTVKYTCDKALYRLFEEYAAAAPEKTAVIYQNDKISYEMLNKNANRIASCLLKKGVKEETLVGVMLERSPLMIETILGIWKAGGAYIPLDIAYPQKRKLAILEDSGLALVVTLSEHVDEKLEKEYKGEFIKLDEIKSDLENESTENPKVSINMRSLAYVLFTSGSTGRPKGAMIEHLGMMNHIHAEINQLRLEEGFVFAQNANHCFDVSVWQMFAAFSKGGTTAVYPEELVLNPGGFAKRIAEDGVTLLEVVPSYLSVMLEFMAEENIKPAGLKYLMITGEAVKPRLVKRWFELFPGIELVNAYGPAEASDDITQFVMDKAPDTENIPIGKPINNINIYITDKNMKLCPVGVIGEICVSGIGVGRGYINDPARTEAAFMEDPFAGSSGERLYKTGDLGRWLPDGNIEFAGRLDYQVKVRGFRIELGEIESKIQEFEGIGETVVCAREDSDRNRYICAYIVPQGTVDTDLLKRHLSSVLPEYMVPAYFVIQDMLPLNKNGKIDVKALPDPDFSMETAREYVAPCNEIEEKLSAIWGDILKLEKVSAEDSFFEIGGHSLKATLLVSKIHKEFDINMPLREVFKAPTIKAMAEYIKNSGKAGYTSIAPADDREYYPASSAQKRLYVLNRLESGGANYNMPAVWIMEGPLDCARLADSFKKLVQRHETLRTSFRIIDGEVVQQIEKNIDFGAELIELGQEELESKVNSFIRPFDLEKAPLIRVCIAKLDTDKHALLYDIHHIVSDGVSENILVNELMAIYSGEELPKLKLQYKDYSVWQNDAAKANAFKEEEEYWLNMFKDEVPVLEMPSDYPRPAVKSFEGENISFEVDEEITKALKVLAKDAGVTMFMLLLAAYNVLLSKYTGQEEIVVGSPVAGRPHDELQSIVGMFANTLALRNFPRNSITFSEFLQNVKNNAVKAFENQNYQFEELVDKIMPVRDLSRNPVFDTMFVMQNEEAGGRGFDSLKIFPYAFGFQPAKFDITLIATQGSDKIALSFEYCTKLFKKATINSFIGHFINLLTQIAINPDTKISDMDIVPKEERDKLAGGFNSRSAVFEQDKTIDQLFSEQVQRTPDNIAVACKEARLTYKQLEERANRLARTLRREGVVPGGIVAIMLERSIDMIVGILAVLKAGGAYLPIDSEYPEERIRYILEDSKAAMLLSHTGIKGRTLFAGKQLEMNDDSIYDADCSALNTTGNPGEIAYVIYTSGSTGMPKGTLIKHTGISNLKTVFIQELGINEKDRVLQFASCSFDASVWEIFMALLTGASLCIVSRDTINNYRKFEEYLNSEGITIATLPPNYLQNLYPDRVDALSLLITAGSAANRNQVERWRQKVRYINAYGPTEATICATFWTAGEEMPDYTSVPIGKPIINTKVYILDKNGGLVPVNVPGELCISGVNVGKGYLNRAELTEEKFVPNPFQKGEVIYRTGDKARWLGDGNIEFLGRIDKQVKIRGFRIELGEIEAAVFKHENVREAVAVCKTDHKGENCLYAYYTADIAIGVSEMKGFLAGVLPDYMVPSFFLQLDKIPVTANGKTDYKALPPVNAEEYNGGSYAEAENATQKAVMKMWQSILGLERIGITAGFFELGGNSLNLIALSAKIHEEYGLEIPFVKLMMSPTIKDISALIDEYASGAVSGNYKSNAVLLNGKHDKNIFAFPHYISYGFIFKSLAASIAEHSFYSFDFIEEEDRLDRYVMEITDIQKEGPYILLGYSLGGNLAFEVAKELVRRGYKVSELILLDSTANTSKVNISPDAIDKEIHNITGQFEGRLAVNSGLGSMLDNPRLKDSFTDRIKKYILYGLSQVNEGSIDANIHLIYSEEALQKEYNFVQKSMLKKYRKEWKELTSGKFSQYSGHGLHDAMLDSDNIEKNASIINGILKS